MRYIPRYFHSRQIGAWVTLLFVWSLAACQAAGEPKVRPSGTTVAPETPGIVPATNVTQPAATLTAAPTTVVSTPTLAPTNSPTAAATRAALRDALALVNGNLIDGTGADLVRDAVIVIEAGHIRAVGPRGQVQIPEGARVIDVQGATMLPGFINAHVHTAYDATKLKAWAQGGVTTVRDLALHASEASWKSNYAARDGELKLPQNARLIGASPMLTVPGGYGSLYVISVQEAREKTNAVLDAGADVIKISFEDDLPGRTWPMLPVEQAKEIVKVAHARGVPVSVHVSRSKHLALALEAGVDDLAHMVVDELPDELIKQIIAANIYWTPTLELWNGVGWGAQPGKNLGRFVAAGGKVALGTDYAGYTIPFDLGMPVHEIEYMRAAGMTPRQIIIAATKNAAHVCNRGRELGTLEAGKVADVLVVDGNPLEDLHALAQIRLVLHEGNIVPR